MIGVANEYTDDALRRTEEAIQMALDEVRASAAPAGTYASNF